MKRHLITPLWLSISLAVPEHLIADIAIDPSEIVGAEAQPASQTQSWTTIAGIGLLLCAFVAVLVVRMKQTRQDKPENSKGVPGESGKG